MTFLQLMWVLQERGLTVVLKDDSPVLVGDTPLLTPDLIPDLKTFRGIFRDIILGTVEAPKKLYDPPDWREFLCSSDRLFQTNGKACVVHLCDPDKPTFMWWATGWRWLGESTWRPMPVRGKMCARVTGQTSHHYAS